MKFAIQRRKDSAQFFVEIQSKYLNVLPPIGTEFEVSISTDGNKFSATTACFLADGRSLMVGNEIVRLNRSALQGKNNSLQLSLGSPVRKQSFICKTMRPVEPKKIASSQGGGDLKSPMTGKILAVNIQNGSKVLEGEVLLTIEAMKMENRIVAECTGTIQNIKIAPGKAVTSGDVLLTLIADISE